MKQFIQPKQYKVVLVEAKQDSH